MRIHRHSALLVLAAVVTCVSAFGGVQNPPSRPGVPARDPQGANRPPATGTGIIIGTVVMAGSGQPARRARVMLSSTDGPGRNATTDDQGRFTFNALPAGRYSLSATKPGHIPSQYGQSRPGRAGTPIQLEEGFKFEARLQLTRGGVLTGTVLDEDGEPTPGTQVRVLRYVMQNGQRALVQSGNGSTDDRGIYRIYGLQPGDYVVGALARNTGGPEPDVLRGEIEAMRQRADALVRAGESAADVTSRIAMLQGMVTSLSDEAPTGYAPVYYPGTTTSAQAATVTLAAGEERPGLDFQLQRVPVARVEGVIVSSSGQSLQNVQVMLTDLQAGTDGPNNSTRADNEGQFRFSTVPPGQYRISVRAMLGERGGGRGEMRMSVTVDGRARGPGAPGQLRLWGSTDIVVDGRNLTNIVIPLQAGVSLSGRLVFQGTSLQPPTELTRIRVSVMPAQFGVRTEGPPPAGSVDASGKFTVAGITPGRYRLSASGAQQGWTLESAVVDGHDSLDFPFEVKGNQNISTAVITFTDQRSELSGALTDSRAQPALGYTLILYPADQRYWTATSRRTRTTRPATDGRFMFSNVPPGDYKIAPVVDVEPGAWMDPAFLQQLDATAMHVRIAEGEKKVQNVRIAGGR